MKLGSNIEMAGNGKRCKYKIVEKANECDVVKMITIRRTQYPKSKADRTRFPETITLYIN